MPSNEQSWSLSVSADSLLLWNNFRTGPAKRINGKESDIIGLEIIRIEKGVAREVSCLFYIDKKKYCLLEIHVSFSLFNYLKSLR